MFKMATYVMVKTILTITELNRGFAPKKKAIL